MIDRLPPLYMNYPVSHYKHKYYKSETDTDAELPTDSVSVFCVIKLQLYTENKQTIGSLH